MAVECPNCGAENPEEKKYCGDCGLPLGAVGDMAAKWQRRLAKQTAYIIILISVLLIYIGLGFNATGEDLRRVYGYFYAGSALVHLAWFLGLSGIGGFFVAGLAYLLSLPIPKKEMKKGLVPEPKPPN